MTSLSAPVHPRHTARLPIRVSCLALLLLLTLLMGQTPTVAQTLTLHDGQVFKGRYLGGTPDRVRLSVSGDTMSFLTVDVRSLTFDPPPPPPPVAASNPGTITVPAGTRLMIRTQSPLMTATVQTGQRFTVKLEADLVANGQVVAARGTPVYGRVVEARAGKRLAGRARLILELTDLSIHNQLVPVITDRLALEGDRAGTLKRTAGGAAIGGILEGDDGVVTGSAVGAGLSLLTPGKQIRIPSGTLIDFRIQQPVTLSTGS